MALFFIRLIKLKINFWSETSISFNSSVIVVIIAAELSSKNWLNNCVGLVSIALQSNIILYMLALYLPFSNFDKYSGVKSLFSATSSCVKNLY